MDGAKRLESLRKVLQGEVVITIRVTASVRKLLRTFAGLIKNEPALPFVAIQQWGPGSYRLTYSDGFRLFFAPMDADAVTCVSTDALRSMTSNGGADQIFLLREAMEDVAVGDVLEVRT
jgi:hypothetical protein